MNATELTYFTALQEDRKENAKVLQKPALRGVWAGIIDKYPESAHFIYELLQNADDAKATIVHIHLAKDGLIFIHNGTEHFTVSNPNTEEEDRETGRLGHLNSITSVGASTKLTSDNKIGKFGVGFKAVFQYTQSPEIYDENIKFRIEQNIVPYILEKDHPQRKKGETLFYIPFNRKDTEASKTYSAIFHKLKELNEPLLFLNCLEEIIWTKDGDIKKYRYTKKRIKKYSFDDIVGELYVLSNAKDQKSSIWTFTEKTTIDKVGTFPITVGYYLNDKSQIDTTIRPYIFCFFPTKESMDLCCVMHAPFALVDSRQNIKRDNDINNTLFKSLAELAAQALVCLCKIGQDEKSYLINDNIFDIAPLESNESYCYDEDDEERGDWENLFYDSYKDVITRNDILITDDKKYVSVSSAVWVVRPIRELLSWQQFNQLLAKYEDPDNTRYHLRYHYVGCSISKNIQEKLNYLDEIGVEHKGIYGFGEMITRQFMEKQDETWLVKFYDFLCRDEAHNLIDTYHFNGKNIQGVLRTKEIIRTNKGTFVPAYIGNKLNVFCSDGNDLPNVNYVDKTLFLSENGRKLLDKLGIKAPDKSNYIESVLMPKYKKSNGKDINEKQIKTDFREIFSAYQACPVSDKDRFVSMLNDNYKLKVLRDCELLSIKDDYIYQPLTELCHYFAHSHNQRVIDLPFYMSCVGNSQKDSLLEFFDSLDLENHILTFYDPISLVECKNKFFKAICNTVHSQSFNITKGYDYIFEGSDIWTKKQVTREVSQCIWNTLLIIIDKINNLLNVKVEFKLGSKLYVFKGGPSKFSNFICNTKWIYNKKGELKKPSEIYREDLDSMYQANDVLFNILDIKPSPRIADMNIIKEQCSAESLRDFELGRAATEMGFSSVEEMQEARRLLEAKKLKDRELDEARKHQIEKQNTKSDTDIHHTQKTHAPEEMFGSVNNPKSQTNTMVDTSEHKKINQLTVEQQNAEQHLLSLEAIATDASIKYTYQWFLALLELEFLKSGERDDRQKGISVYFNKVTSDPHSPRCLLLRNPSHEIPRSLEDMGDIVVTFYVDGIKDCAVSFEAASVIDYTLRLKFKNEDIKIIEKLKAVQSHITRAELKINTPIKLISSLRDCYENMDLNPKYSLKEHINPQLKFIFGPPGTGKTTHLVDNWIRKVAESDSTARMLILCPTNKAADVIASRALDMLLPEYPDLSSWLGRFVATADESLSEFVCSRNSDFYAQEKCCVISTIARFSFDQFRGDYLKDIKWDYIVIDEASMIPLAEILYPIYRCKNSQIVIAGDPFQIDPIVNERLWERENIYTMVNLNDFAHPKTEPCVFDIHNLTTQFRSIPAIGKLFSDYAYQGKVESYRKQSTQRPLKIDGYEIKSINFIGFPVEKGQSIYSAQRISNSNVHIYSILFVNELVNYFSAQIQKNHPDEKWRVGIICPYKAQAELINKLWEQRTEQFPNIEVQVGTVHGFQGDECDIIFAVYNPPASGMKRTADKTFVNRKNILNVAISRAKDYLFILLPDKEYDCFDNLVEARMVGQYAFKQKDNMTYHLSQDIERVIFGDDNYLLRNSFVTNHQLGNVYSKPTSQYEIRIDESSMDIQVKY